MRRTLFALGLSGLLTFGCWTSSQDSEAPDVLLITLDTTRADRLGCYGNDRIATPYLDRLAGQGTRFERAFTPVPSTLPSHSSILTGLHPARHGVHDNGLYRLDESFHTLAERLRDQGYRTGAFVSSYVLDRRFGLAQGFDVYDDAMVEPLQERPSDSMTGKKDHPEHTRRWLRRQSEPFQRRAEDVTRSALDWLRGRETEPIFLWVHYFDPHMSYQPPEPWASLYATDYQGELDGTMAAFLRLAKSRGGYASGAIPDGEILHMKALYDGEISYMDEWIGKLLEELEATKRWDNTLVVVVGDHGEGFGEHGQFWEHNAQIFDEVMRVPLIVKRPGRTDAGLVDPSLVSTLDVVPTILTEAGLPEPQEAQGVPLFSTSAQRPRQLLFEALHGPQMVAAKHSWLGLRGDQEKLILLLDPEGQPLRSGFYDLGSDAGERESLHESRSEEMERWKRQALDLYSSLEARGPASSIEGLDSETREALEALGYLK